MPEPKGVKIGLALTEVFPPSRQFIAGKIVHKYEKPPVPVIIPASSSTSQQVPIIRLLPVVPAIGPVQLITSPRASTTSVSTVMITDSEVEHQKLSITKKV